MKTEHTLAELRIALAIEREVMNADKDRRAGSWIVPVEEIKARAGFYLSNDERSRVEIADFIADVPAEYFAYRSQGQTFNITNWYGAEIARVTTRGTPYRSNFGDRRQSFRAVAINGAAYAGIAYLDSGDYVRMRTVKADKRESAQARAYADGRA